MVTQAMFRPVGERQLRSMPSHETHLIGFAIFSILILTFGFVELMFKVEQLKGTYGLVQMLRMVAVAHVFRFLQSILGENKVTPIYYLRKVLLFQNLPITVSIAAFYTAIRTLPRSQHLLPIMAIWFLLSTLIGKTKRRELGKDISPTHGPSNHSIGSITNFSRSETKDTIHTVDIEVFDDFAIIVLTGICVDLVVHVERLRGTNETFYMFLVFVGRHGFYIIQSLLDPNNVRFLSYQRKVLLFYDIPFTATFASFYFIFQTSSFTLIFLLVLEVSYLAQIHNSISERDNFKIIQSHDAANNSTSSDSNFGRRQIWDPPIRDGGLASVRVASNRVSKDLRAVKKEDPAAANSISQATNFGTWEKGERIGSGGYGTVYVARNRAIRDLCAVKEINNMHKPEHVESIKKEIKIIGQLKHPNIVKYYDHGIVGDRISLYMEYIQPGSLKQYISERGFLREHLIRNFTAQILSGLVYLHGKRVVHRDIKPDNLLVDSNNTVKLVDFGLSKYLAESVGKHSELGTPYYAAPEVLKKIEYKSSREASAADIWSLGCVIIEMFSGKHPWPGFDPVQASFKVCFKGEHPPIPEELCSKGKDFLKLCFRRTPTQRPSAAALLHHPFVKAQTL